MELKNSQGNSQENHRNALPCMLRDSSCSESSQQTDFAKPSEPNNLPQKGVQCLAVRYSKYGFTPSSFFLATTWRSLRRWCCSAWCSWASRATSSLRWRFIGCGCFSYREGRTRSSIEFPENRAKERPVTQCMAVPHRQGAPQKISTHPETSVFKNHKHRTREV